MPSFATRRTFVVAALAMAGVAAAGKAFPDGEEPMLTITGELTYLQRIALPNDAVAIVELKPSDAADGESVTAETRLPLNGAQVPVAFELDVERALDPAKTYMLRGGILVGSEMRWLSDSVEIDTTAEAVSVGTLRLSPYESPNPADASAAIFDTEWKITAIGDTAIVEDARPTLTITDDGSFHGKACNSFGGSYEVGGEKLSFGRITATMMACPEPLMAQEGALFSALEKVAGFNLAEDGTLQLSDEAGNTLIEARR